VPASKSGWTIDTLKEFFDHTIQDRDVRVNLALSAAKEAVTKAEGANDKRLDLLNEFRAQMADEASKYALNQLVNQKFDSLDQRVARNETGLSSLQGRALAMAGIGAVIGGVAAALILKLMG
jgi:hypothetical protein